MTTASCSYRLSRTAALRSLSGPRSTVVTAQVSARLSTFDVARPALSPPLSYTGLRHASSQSGKNADKDDEWSRHRAQYNYDPFTLHPEAKHYAYPLVTADQLASSTSAPRSMSRGPGGRPREVRMLARDFIHDSLYNPSYGYFTKQAVLLPDPAPQGEAEAEGDEGVKEVAGELYTEEMGVLRPANPGFDFNSIKNESEFMRLVEERYQLFETQIALLVQERQNNLDAQAKEVEFQNSLARERKERLDRRNKREQKKQDAPEYSAAGLEAAQLKGRAMQREGVQEGDVQSMAAKQVWHTPTQIFQPYYAQALARYLVAEYKLHNYPYDDLVIYECGAGSGALAQGILNYLAEQEPEIYTRTRYRIIEISQRLAMEQERKLKRHRVAGIVEVVHQDVLSWDKGVVQEPCFVIALEVFDNLAHDVVRFSLEDLTPYQAVVSIDETGDMHELYEPLSDPLIKRYLSLIGPSLSPLANSPLRFLPSSIRGALARHVPFFPNLSTPIYLPTNALCLMEKLKTHFPQHRLIMSDFDSLPDACEGINAPVVQTRHRSTMIPVTTYLVLQGFFDIFFPTNFDHLKKVYKTVINGSERAAVGEGEGEGAAVSEFFSSHFSPPAVRAGVRTRERNLRVYSHAEFLQRYAEVEKLQLKDGSNPLLTWYQNASWFLS